VWGAQGFGAGRLAGAAPLRRYVRERQIWHARLARPDPGLLSSLVEPVEDTGGHPTTKTQRGRSPR